MSDYISKDVWVDILVNLPLKNLVRCSCVCKSWYSLITSPYFISAHLNYTTNQLKKNDNGLLLIRRHDMFDKICRYTLHFDNEKFNEFTELKCPFNSENEYFRIVGSCDGLICLSDDYDNHTDNVYIWNPLIRKSVVVPKPQFECSPPVLCLVGFGFDCVGNDYKVVRIVYETMEKYNFKVPPAVELYTLSTGTWKSLCEEVAPRYNLCDNSPSPPFVNGAVHWVAAPSGDEKGNVGNVIVAFDMGHEVFREIMLPESVTDKNVIKLSVRELDKSLALVEYEKIMESDYCWVWVMTEYGVRESWTRLLTIDMRGGIRTLVGFAKQNEVLLSARVIGMVSYDSKAKQLNYLGIHGTDRSFYADAYVESLVLLDKVSRQGTFDNAVNDEARRLPVEDGILDEQQQSKASIEEENSDEENGEVIFF